jgi:hypothetical protein
VLWFGFGIFIYVLRLCLLAASNLYVWMVLILKLLGITNKFMNCYLKMSVCRYAPARRGGGMTSLGKIAVPKPINLPSQRY